MNPQSCLLLADIVNEPPPVHGLAVIDWIIIVIYALGTLWLGWHFGRQQTSTKEYFVGSGGMNTTLIGISLFATLLSTISYLSIPGEAIGKGPVWMASMLSYPFVFLVAGFIMLPVYMRQKVTSAYELLEERLGKGTRRLGGALFISLRLVWMSTLIYFAATALAIIFNVDPKWEPLIVAITGFVAVGYTSLGGLRAVVITDLMQTILLYFGAVLTISIITFKMGGFGWFPTEWHSSWDNQPLFSFDPSVRVSVMATIFSVLIWQIATIGGDQTSVQRFMATTDAKAARRSLAANLIVGVIVLSTLFLAGFALLGYYEHSPEALGGGLTLKDNADKVFPYFIASGLPPIVAGLVVSAIFAAAMSSIDSGINSITAVVTTDFLPPVDGEDKERRRLKNAKWLAFLIGAIIVAASSLVKFIPGNITAITNKTVNLLTVPIFCLFFFALFVKNAKPLGAWIGCVAGVITAGSIAFSGPIFGFAADTARDPVSFIWMAPATLVVNISVGWLACCVLPSRESKSNRVLSVIPAAMALAFVAMLLTSLRPSMHINLSEADRARCVKILREGLHSDEFWPSIHAAEGLTIGGHGDEVREYLEPKLTTDLDDQQKCGVARELYRAGDHDKAKIMLDILKSSNDFGHIHAAESLYKVYPIGDDSGLRHAFESAPKGSKLGLMAAGALAKAGDANAMAYLREMLQSDTLDIYQISAWILARIGSAEDIKPIRDRLEETKDPIVRAYLEHALASLGDKKGLAALNDNLKNDDAAIRTYAATFAGDARAVGVSPKLLKLLDDPNLDTRIRAAQSLLDLANR